MVVCLERGADLHMAQLIPLPLTVSCFIKIQIGFTSLVPAHLGSPGKGPLNGCVCVCVCQLQADCKNRDQLWNNTLGNQVWATFTFFNDDLKQTEMQVNAMDLCCRVAAARQRRCRQSSD